MPDPQEHIRPITFLPPPPKVKEVMFSLLSVYLFLSLSAGYLKKLWTDSDETLWTRCVCVTRKNCFDIGEDPNPDLDARII